MQAFISNLISTGQTQKIRLFLLLILPFLGLTNCGKEKIATKEYPRIITLSVARNIDSVITFNGEVISGDLSQIIEYGFVWDKYSNSPYLETSQKIVMAGAPGSSKFSSEVQNLTEGQSFNYRAYAKTNDLLIYGNVISY
jgi:hypothetical protein